MNCIFQKVIGSFFEPMKSIGYPLLMGQVSGLFLQFSRQKCYSFPVWTVVQWLRMTKIDSLNFRKSGSKTDPSQSLFSLIKPPYEPIPFLKASSTQMIMLPKSRQREFNSFVVVHLRVGNVESEALTGEQDRHFSIIDARAHKKPV